MEYLRKRAEAQNKHNEGKFLRILQMPDVYWPCEGEGIWIKANDILAHVSFASEWGQPPWELAGRNPDKWRDIYFQIASFQSQVDTEIQQKSQAKKTK